MSYFDYENEWIYKPLKDFDNNTKKEPKIFDYETNSYLGISLWNEETIQAITKNSGKLTKSNEYQVHYWSLNMRKRFEDGSIIDISIPTCFFNYKQEVTSATVDFELKDVIEMSEQIYVLQQAQEKKLISKVKEYFKDWEITSVPFNSLHKHPGGRRQGFSSTDYNKSHTYDTGIVFPLKKANMTPNFASIINISEGKTWLSHTEYRMAHGDVESNEGISYYEGPCYSYVKVPKEELNSAEMFFDFEEREDESYKVGNRFQFNKALEMIIEWWKGIDYSPDTQFINEENITEKRSYRYNKPKTKQTKKETKKKETKKDNYLTIYEQEEIKQYNKSFGVEYEDNDIVPVYDSLNLDLNTIDYIESILEQDNIMIEEPYYLKEYEPEELLELQYRLEEYYYGKEVSQKYLTPKNYPTYNDIVELQNLIIEEILFQLEQEQIEELF